MSLAGKLITNAFEYMVWLGFCTITIYHFKLNILGIENIQKIL